MKILCPTDLYEAANNATAYAAKLAKATGASLTLINVRVLAELSVEEALYGEDLNIEIAEDTLEDLADDISKTFRISCDYIVTSSVAGLIKDIKNESSGFDLIVMGTEGPAGISEKILGSKAYQVALNASIPVLLIPISCGYSEITNIAYACDYWQSTDVPLTQAIQFASRFNAKMTMVQVLEKYSRKVEEEMLAREGDLKKGFESQIELLFKTLYHSNIKEALGDYAKSEGVDVVIMHSTSHNFLSRVFKHGLIQKISDELTFPLLIVHK